MSNFFSKAEVTSSGRPVFLCNEVECHLLSGVDLEPEDQRNFFPLKSGIFILTTHRLLWLPSSSTTTPTFASAIPLAAISHIFSPKKSLKFVLHSPRIRFQVFVSPDGRVFDPGSGFSSGLGLGSRSVVMTVVVRGKGDYDGFLVKFWDCWRTRAWESNETSVFGSGLGLASGSGAGIGTDGGLYSTTKRERVLDLLNS